MPRIEHDRLFDPFLQTYIFLCLQYSSWKYHLDNLIIHTTNITTTTWYINNIYRIINKILSLLFLTVIQLVLNSNSIKASSVTIAWTYFLKPIFEWVFNTIACTSFHIFMDLLRCQIQKPSRVCFPNMQVVVGSLLNNSADFGLIKLIRT